MPGNLEHIRVVRVDPSTPVGAVQLVFEGEAGKSTATFAVDRFPGVVETGITDSARASQSVKLPASIVGAIDRAGDVDFYRFEAKAGDEIGAQVVAAELGSKLDPALVLTDSAGKVLAEGTSILGYRVSQPGGYAVGIRDKDYRGSADMGYRLPVGNIPVVTGVFPLAVQRGRTADVHLEGVNLGAAGIRAKVSVPADAVPGSRVPVSLPLTGERPLGEAAVTVGEFSSVVVDPSGGAELRVPGSADGILGKPNEAQLIRFTAKKGNKLVVEVLARRAGSPVDPDIEILDESGKPVPRAILRGTAKVYSTFRDHDSASSGVRLETWNELAIDDYLFADGELTRIFALPKGPDDDCQFYQAGGRRVGYLGTIPATTARAHPCTRWKSTRRARPSRPTACRSFRFITATTTAGPGTERIHSFSSTFRKTGCTRFV